MTILQNMPGKIVGLDAKDRIISIQMSLHPTGVKEGDAVIVSSVPESEPSVGRCDVEAARKFVEFMRGYKKLTYPFDDRSFSELETAFARHRENAR